MGYDFAMTFGLNRSERNDAAVGVRGVIARAITLGI